MKPVQNDRRGDAGAAISDELSVWNVAERLVPRRVHRAGDASRLLVDRVRLAAPARGETGVDDDELVEAPHELVGLDRVVVAGAWREVRGFDRLLPARERPVPAVELEHGAVVVAEVAQEPPEPLGAAHVAVGDDEHALADSGTAGCVSERFGIRQRVTAARAGLRREVGVDVEEARAGDVSPQIQLAPTAGVAELPATVDELVAQGYQLPATGVGNATDAGWIT